MGAIQTRSGTQVRYQGLWKDTARGYVLTAFSVIQYRWKSFGDTDPDLTISVQWVGDMEHLSTLLQTNQYAEEEATFLEQQLGISRDLSKTRRTPQPLP